MVGGPTTPEEAEAALAVARDVCARLEPAVVPMHEVPDLFDSLVALERCAGGAVLRMAARYEEAGAWKRSGAKSAEDDIARKTGTGSGKARRRSKTSKRLTDQPRTRTKRSCSTRLARTRCTRCMAEVDAALRPRIDRAFADARDAGRMERVEAYTADVVRDLLLGAGGGSAALGRRSQAVRPEKKVIALIDVSALNRGTVEAGETCEIAGVGPVSVSAIRALLSEAFLTVVIRDGIDVLNVTHLGRQVTAAQRTALEARGAACGCCGSRYLLDIDHNEGWTLTRDTRVEDPGSDPPDGGTDPPVHRPTEPAQPELFTLADRRRGDPRRPCGAS